MDTSSFRARTPTGALRSAAALFWSAADAYTKRRMVAAFGLVATGSLFAALVPYVLKLLIDQMSGAGEGQPATTALTLLIFYVSGQYLWRCSTELRIMIHGHAEQRLRRRLGGQLFDHLIRMPMRFHLDRKTGATTETVDQGMHGVQTVITHLVYTVLPVAIELIAIAVILTQIQHARYLIVLALAAVAYAFAFRRWARTGSESTQNVSATHIESRALFTDALVNAETIKYFDAERAMTQRYDAALSQSESAWQQFFKSNTGNGLLVATIFATSLGISLAFALRDVSRGVLTIGDFVLVNAYVARLVQPLELVGFAIREIAQGLAFLSAMMGLLQNKPESDPGEPHGGGFIGHGDLTFDAVSFRYRDDHPTLESVSFRVPARSTVAIVGVSGAGKSSLIRLLFRLYEPNAGQILVDGVPISQMRLSEVRRAIAVVPQDTVLFHDTISKNIGFGRPGATQSEVEEAARLANLHDWIMRLPERYETIVGERGLKLSGGERQRVAIARAALKKPRIFVFDEATSSLDTKTEREILRNLRHLSSKSTALVIAHRLSTIVHADEIVVMSNGTVAERGTHARLLSLNGHYAALWAAQQSAADRDESPVVA